MVLLKSNPVFSAIVLDSFTGLGLISLILLIMGALGVRLLKEKKSWWIRFHHAFIISGYFFGILGYITLYLYISEHYNMDNLPSDVFPFSILAFLGLLILTSALILGPFNLKFREQYKIFQIIHLLVGYASFILLLLTIIVRNLIVL